VPTWYCPRLWSYCRASMASLPNSRTVSKLSSASTALAVMALSRSFTDRRARVAAYRQHGQASSQGVTNSFKPLPLQW